MEKEQWRVIPEFDLYEVSNFGRIKSKPRTRKNGQGYYQTKEVILNGSDTKGYRSITLKQDGKSKRFYIHRLVAMAFIPNPERKPFINHKDNNPSNNRAENLEWCTPQENTDWMIAQGRFKRNSQWLERLHKSQEKYYRAIKATNILTGETLFFKCINETKIQGFQPSCVCNCCNGKRKAHAGYYWEYMEG